MPVRFKNGRVVFRNRKVWFDVVCCGACPGHHTGDPTPCTIPAGDTGDPSCVRLPTLDFTCPDPDEDCGDNDPFDGILVFNGSDAWTTPDYTDPREFCTATFKQVRVTLNFDGIDCLFRLSISSGATLVWQGEKDTGDSPCGIYYRVDGCDTRPTMTIG